MKKTMSVKEIVNIEKSFFDIDEKTNVAHIILSFDRPGDIFDTNYISGTPVLSDDFMDWIQSAFELVSPKYRIDLTVRFNDMSGYTGEQLSEIFRKNIDLEFKSKLNANRNRNKIAVGLVGIGVTFFIAMMLISRLWATDSVWKEIFIYMSDIATTVTFWEAMTILVVEQKEKRAYLRNLKHRFSAIAFEKQVAFEMRDRCD